MISHKHKCIFIHIAKCAGTSIEHALGVDVNNHKAEDNDNLFGWDTKNNLWLQHATPQQLLDLGYISKSTWDNYYKFIVYRNSWDRAYSDYVWMYEVRNVKDSFQNFIYKKGYFKKILNDNSSNFYAGDHVLPQKDYFFLNGKRINYNREIEFSSLSDGLKMVINDLGLSKGFFDKKMNVSNKKKKNHYSKFYNKQKRDLVATIYKDDIEFFDFSFEDKKTLLRKMILSLKSL